MTQRQGSGLRRVVCFAILLMLALSGPGAAADPASRHPQRIVSLSPSTTEILFAMGMGDRIVGVTSYCDYPEEARKKPKIGGMSNPSIESVVGLKPDVVVLTKDGNPKEFEGLLRSLKIRTVVFSARKMSELSRGVRELGRELDATEGAEGLAGRIDRELHRMAAVHRKPGAAEQKVLFIVWPEPLLVAGPGTAIDDAIALLGRKNMASSALSTYPKYSLEEVLRQAPDVIVIGKGTGMDMVEISRGLLERMTAVPAVRNNAVCYLGDGLYRLGPRIIQGIEELAVCLERN